MHASSTDGPASVESSTGSSSSSASSEDGDSTGAIVPRKICDGSNALRLVIREGASDGPGGDGGMVFFTWLYTQIGTRYLYVRGDCRYWVVPFQPYQRVPAHTGVLDDAEADALSLELGYDRWPVLEGTYSGSGAGGFVVFSDTSATLRCADACDGFVGTDELRGWAARWDDLVDELYAQGEPVAASDPLRVDGHYTELAPDGPMPECTFDWPFSFDPTTAGVSPPPYPKNEPAITRSHPVTDPAVAAEIRAYWDDYTAAYEPGEMCSIEWLSGRFLFIAPDDPQATISMWIRDAVPFENEDGLVPVPMPEPVFPPEAPE
jgi:hypothetical protein